MQNCISFVQQIKLDFFVFNDKMRKMKKLLIVDDEEDFLDLLNNFLKKKYYQIYASRSGKKALEIFHQEKPNLILLDIKMPDMDGFLVLEKIREVDQDIKIIVITGMDDRESIDKAKRLGADGYIVKPFDLDTLASTIAASF